MQGAALLLERPLEALDHPGALGFAPGGRGDGDSPAPSPRRSRRRRDPVAPRPSGSRAAGPGLPEGPEGGAPALPDRLPRRRRRRAWSRASRRSRREGDRSPRRTRTPHPPRRRTGWRPSHTAHRPGRDDRPLGGRMAIQRPQAAQSLVTGERRPVLRFTWPRIAWTSSPRPQLPVFR